MAADPDHRVVAAVVIGVPEPGTAVWRAEGERSADGSPVTGDLQDPDHILRAGDHVVLEIVRERFRWLVVGVREVVPSSRAPAPVAPHPHAHPGRPPGTVLIAWLPFTRDDDEGPGKHRPCVVLRSTDPQRIRARPLYDPGSAIARRSGGVRLQAWRAAGLDKPSAAVAAVEIPVGRCEQTLGHLDPVDLAALGIAGRRPR